MAFYVKWLGQGGFELSDGEASILLDPYLSDSLTRKYAQTDKPHVRMTELANAAMLSSGGLTRLAGRLEERGFVQRDQDTADGRAFYAKLTERGRRLLTEARVTHDAVVHDLFGAYLPAADIDSMTRALARVLGPDRRT